MKKIISIIILTCMGLYAQIIKGVVVDTGFNILPGIIAEARNTFYPDSVFYDTTGVSGNFSIQVTPGYYEIKIFDPNLNFIPFHLDGIIHANQGDTADLGTIIIYPATTIETLKVIVKDKYTFLSISNARITIKAPFERWEGFTNQSGYETFELYSTYIYDIKANRFGYKQKDTFHFQPLVKDSIILLLDTVPQSAMGAISGEVFDLVSHTPLDSAKVIINNISLPDPPLIITTDSNGKFLDTVIPGPYTVASFKLNYLPQIFPRVIYVQPGINAGPVRIPLTPVPPTSIPGTLVVRVYDTLTLTPIKSCLVFTFDRVNLIATSLFTNENGFAVFENIPSDTIYKYSAVIFKRNYFKKRIFIGKLNTGGITNIDVYLKPKYDPSFSKGIIDGKIQVNSNTAKTSKVIIQSLNTRVLKGIDTDTTGYFKFTTLPPDTYRIFIYAKYASPYDTTVFLNNDSLYLNINLIKNNTGSYAIDGMVIDEYTGYPIPNCLITAYDSSGQRYITFSDSAGMFVLDSLPFQKYILSARFPGYMTEFFNNAYRLREALWIYPSSQESVEFSLIPLLNPEEGVIIKGKVLGLYSSRKAQSGEAEIYLFDLTEQRIISSTKTDKNGNFVLMGIPPNSGHDWTVYSVSPEGEGYSEVFTFADDTSGILVTTDIQELPVINKNFKIYAFPTLFKNKIYFVIDTDRSLNGELSIFDITGRKIVVLKKGKIKKGIYIFTPELKSGIYFWILKEKNKKYEGGKIIRIR